MRLAKIEAVEAVQYAGMPLDQHTSPHVHVNPAQVVIVHSAPSPSNVKDARTVIELSNGTAVHTRLEPDAVSLAISDALATKALLQT